MQNTGRAVRVLFQLQLYLYLLYIYSRAKTLTINYPAYVVVSERYYFPGKFRNTFPVGSTRLRRRAVYPGARQSYFNIRT